MCFTPSLEEVQETINSVARDVLSCCEKVVDWGLDDTGAERPRHSFYHKLSADKVLSWVELALQCPHSRVQNLAVVLLLLSGSINGTKQAAAKHLETYQEYQWLWTTEPEDEYAAFVAGGHRILEDFIAELHGFVRWEEKIEGIADTENIASLRLQATNLKGQLKREVERWKFQYSEKLHQEVEHPL